MRSCFVACLGSMMYTSCVLYVNVDASAAENLPTHRGRARAAHGHGLLLGVGPAQVVGGDQQRGDGAARGLMEEWAPCHFMSVLKESKNNKI